MESWRRTLVQFRDLFNNMAPSQRMTLVIVPLFVLAGLGLVMYLGVGPAEEALLLGKAFSTEELKSAETALRKVNLGQYRIVGQQILVPRAEVTRYNAALAMGDAVPEFGQDLDKAIDVNPFLGIGEGQRRDRVDLGKAKELVKIIKAVPFVEDARLVTQRPRQRGFNGESKMTATLGVRLRGGRELVGDLAQSLRQTVAGGFGMAPADVTVVDMKTGKAPRLPDPGDPSGSGYVETTREFTALHQQTIAEALAYIPNVLVSVNVDLDTLMESHEQERKYDPKQFPYKTVEETENETSNETGPGSEPGAGPNTPRQIRQPVTSKNARTIDKTRTASDSVPTSTRVTRKHIHGFTPKSVQVAVSIPKDYYRDVAIKEGTNESDKAAFAAKVAQLKTETEKDVREKIAKLIPLPATGTATDLINVSSYTALETTEAPVAVSMTTRVGEAVTQWGGPAGLALFALWALWMLNRSMKRVPDGATGAAAGKSTASKAAGTALAAAGDEDEEELAKEPTKRDKLQTLVKDNPEMAAAVLSRWLSPPK
jgi:flagellar M-ring protein FliF